MGHVIFRVSLVSTNCEKVDCVMSTLQGANFLLLVLSQTTCMFLDKMDPYPLRMRPTSTAEGTLVLPNVFVSNMLFQVLGSLIHVGAIGKVMQPCISLAMILRVPCASHIMIWILSSFLKF